MTPIYFTVEGTPATAGSKRAFPIWRGTGPTKTFVRAVVTDDCAKGKSWRALVQDRARGVFPSGTPLLTGPLSVTFQFILNRPKGHYGAKGVKASAPNHHAKKPDVLKMARALEDALTGVIWEDDAQICREVLYKDFSAPGESEGVQVRVSTVE